MATVPYNLLTARIRMKDGGDMENKDASRPFFQRQPGEMGVHLIVYDAVAVNPKDFGSEHFFIMDLMDKLYEQFSKVMDPITVRASLDRKGPFKGIYIERFEKGITLALGFDSVEALENIWNLNVNGKLNHILQEVLVTPALLEKVGATKIVLKTRMFTDEYADCKDELKKLSDQKEKLRIISIKTKAPDMAVLERLKAFQTHLNEEVEEMREIEYKFNKNLGEFIMTLKQVLPANLTSLKSLKEFDTNMKMAKGLHGKKMAHVDKYFEIIEKWRSKIAKIEEKVCQPIVQIHAICETDKQNTVKSKIQACCKEIKGQLQPDANLQSIRHEEWTRKLMKKEQSLFGGLISLVPLGADAAFDINCMLDEYINDFPL
ncbi:hypothetical protein FSP39_014166 [Pinctada imbricata]|uniref:Uncharacterized protein n=1 Tax=Pinctada imbricata TaxID=66713 RepID=A0AA89BNK8_PINIB|nr:hypothetical protein FSP39_014166 [Pinctada imbricata]